MEGTVPELTKVRIGTLLAKQMPLLAGYRIACSLQTQGTCVKSPHGLIAQALLQTCVIILEQGENKAANVTHSFRPIIKLLALCIREYRGRGVIFAVFRHSCVVVDVVDGGGERAVT